LLVLLILLPGSSSFGQIQAGHEISPSRVVWHIVARSLVNPSNGTSQVAGYLTDLDGVSGSLFNGTPSESTAFLTLRTDVFASQPLPMNGNLTLSLPEPVKLHLYFNPNPCMAGGFRRAAMAFSSAGDQIDLKCEQPTARSLQQTRFGKIPSPFGRGLPVARCERDVPILLGNNEYLHYKRLSDNCPAALEPDNGPETRRWHLATRLPAL
jgi:hypothetical protein